MFYKKKHPTWEPTWQFIFLRFKTFAIKINSRNYGCYNNRK